MHRLISLTADLHRAGNFHSTQLHVEGSQRGAEVWFGAEHSHVRGNLDGAVWEPLKESSRAAKPWAWCEADLPPSKGDGEDGSGLAAAPCHLPFVNEDLTLLAAAICTSQLGHGHGSAQHPGKTRQPRQTLPKVLTADTLLI